MGCLRQGTVLFRATPPTRVAPMALREVIAPRRSEPVERAVRGRWMTPRLVHGAALVGWGRRGPNQSGPLESLDEVKVQSGGLGVGRAHEVLVWASTAV
jgi:hypothetical protein